MAETLAETSTETGLGCPETVTINVNLFKLISQPFITDFASLWLILKIKSCRTTYLNVFEYSNKRVDE